MEPEGSLPCWQEPSTGPYPDVELSTCITEHEFNADGNLKSGQMDGLKSWNTYLHSPIQSLYWTVESMQDLRFSWRWLWSMPSSGIWRRVVLVWTDVSEEYISAILRVQKSASEETMWAAGCIFPSLPVSKNMQNVAEYAPFSAALCTLCGSAVPHIPLASLHCTCPCNSSCKL
jgi:hypothetical protein